MNFSNFFIDMLSGTESSLPLGSKKSATPAFLFSDIMKVCEAESTNTAGNAIPPILVENPKEIFSASDSVINIQPQEFDTITQLVALIIKEAGSQQSAITTHDIDEVKITKQQFLVTENKLVDLLSDLIEKGNYPLGPFIHQLQSSESNKAISLSFKSGADKLTISFNPIKVDEKYTDLIINDEYGFVNKLIVREGLLSTPAEELTSDVEASVTENDVEQEKPVGIEEGTKLSDQTSPEIPNQLFFRTEIIKIVSTNSASGNVAASILPIDGETSFSTFLAYKNFVKDNKLVDESLSNSKSSTNVNDALLSRNIKYTLDTMKSSPAEVEKNTATANLILETKPVVNTDGSNQVIEKNPLAAEPIKVTSVSKNEINVDKPSELGKGISIASLLDGLSDEEKSVFKNIASSGELKEIKYTKNFSNSSDQANLISESKIKACSDTLPFIANETLIKNSGSTQNQEVIASNDSKTFYPIVLEDEKPNVKPILTNTENNPVLVTEKNSDIKQPIEGAKISVKMNAKSVFVSDTKAEITVANPSVDAKHETVIADTNVDAKDNLVLKTQNSNEEKNIKEIVIESDEVVLQNEPANKSTKIFVKINTKFPGSSDTKVEVLNADSGKNDENKSVLKPVDSIKKVDTNENLIDTGDPISEPQQNKNAKIETAVSDKKIIVKQTFEFDTKSVSQPEKPSEKENVVVDQKKDVPLKEKNLEVSRNPVEVVEKNKAASKPESTIGKTETTIHQDVASRLNIKEEKTTTVKDNVDSKENISDEIKTVKHAAQDSKADLATDDDASKRGSHESFKNTFTQAVSSDLDVEKTKMFSDLKTFHEPVKVIKQSEIIPEFSKLIQQNEKQSITFQITPENLGKVKLTVDLVNNQIQTNIEVENEQIKQFIQANVEQLKQNLQSSGINMNNVNISLADYSQKNTNKMFAPKKKASLRGEKEIPIEEITDQPLKKMGYNTYEFLA